MGIPGLDSPMRTAPALVHGLTGAGTISGASSGGCCSLGLRYGARGAGDEPFLLASHRVGEPQGAEARLPGVYFQRGLFLAGVRAPPYNGPHRHNTRHRPRSAPGYQRQGVRAGGTCYQKHEVRSSSKYALLRKKKN